MPARPDQAGRGTQKLAEGYVLQIFGWGVRRTLVVGSLCAASVFVAPNAMALDMRHHLVLGHDRCVSASSYTMDGHGLGALSNQDLYHHYHEYRQCGEKRTFAPTHRPDPNRDQLSIGCRPGFKFAGSPPSVDHTAWHLWIEGGRWNIREFGSSGYSHWTTQIALEMQNLDVGGYWPDHEPHSWAARMFATCERLPDYHF